MVSGFYYFPRQLCNLFTNHLQMAALGSQTLVLTNSILGTVSGPHEETHGELNRLSLLMRTLWVKKKKKNPSGGAWGGDDQEENVQQLRRKIWIFHPKNVSKQSKNLRDVAVHQSPPSTSGWDSLTSDYKCLRTSAPILQTRIFPASRLSAWPTG